MASWSGVLALSGFRYHGGERHVEALPRLPLANFRCFWSTGTGWGTFSYGADRIAADDPRPSRHAAVPIGDGRDSQPRGASSRRSRQRPGRAVRARATRSRHAHHAERRARAPAGLDLVDRALTHSSNDRRCPSAGRHRRPGMLGAGKTTLIVESAKRLIRDGRRVGVITNDQGTGLIDTSLAEVARIPVGEVAGGCFCCRFSDFLDAALGAARARRRDSSSPSRSAAASTSRPRSCVR